MSMNEETREREVEKEVAEDREVRDEMHVEDENKKTSPMQEEYVSLLDEDEAEEFRAKWQDIQTGFVDDPRHSVENADDLVEKVMNSITETFADERASLEDQWNRGVDASTEDLRLAMKRYRSFFNRLLTLESSEKSRAA